MNDQIPNNTDIKIVEDLPGIKNDAWIIAQCTNKAEPMISPFVPHQERYSKRVADFYEVQQIEMSINEGDSPETIAETMGVHKVSREDSIFYIHEKIISFGTSSFGYDVRLGRKFKIFTNIKSTLIDPMNMSDDCYVDHEGDFVIIPPHSYVLGHTLETFNMPRDVTAICVGKSTYARCFAGETKVMLTDGSTPSFLELIKRVEQGERLFGYSINNEMEIVISELFAPRKTGTEEVIEVVLDNNEIIECTPDHKFITRDGLEIKAKDLAAGDSLFPLYKIQTRGYEAVVQPNTWTYISGHSMADDWNLRHSVYVKGENEHRHHLNENRLDNTPTNIVRKDAGDHIREHNQERYSDREYVKRISEIHKSIYEENIKDSEWVKKWSDQCSKAALSFWHDPKHEENREKHRQKILAYQNSPEGLTNREKLRQATRLRANTEAAKKESSERIKLLWADPDFRAMMVERGRELKIRKDINEKEVIEALESEGSIRGAARKLNCDRTVFRRFIDTISLFKEKWEASKLTVEDFYNAMCKYGSATKAAKALKIGRSTATRHFGDAIRKFYNTPSLDNNHKVVEIRKTGAVKDVYCLTAPDFSNFALASGVFVNNCGTIVNVTPIEAGFKGEVVIEIANLTPLPMKVYAGMGISQFLFFQGTECSVAYGDRAGKYQNQRGITTARV